MRHYTSEKANESLEEAAEAVEKGEETVKR
jgi:hypothetical protein